MNVHVSYKLAKTPDLEKELNQQVEKLRRRLQAYQPELVHLHAGVTRHAVRERAAVSLNLRLPSGQIACAQIGATAVAAAKLAFDDLLEQLGRHQERLRAGHKRVHRRQAGQPDRLGLVPFEETIAAVKLPRISEEDIRGYVNTKLWQLARFVDRELRYREANGELRPGLVWREEVVDEAVAMALGNDAERPERLKLEAWLYRLALTAIRELARGNAEHEDAAVPLHRNEWKQNVGGSDEAALQFHQPDESMRVEDKIPDRSAATPEEIAYDEEVVELIESALLGAGRMEREAFLLYAVEGFSPEEIATIGGHTADEVRQSILAAREHLRRAIPMCSQWKDKLLEQTKIA